MTKLAAVAPAHAPDINLSINPNSLLYFCVILIITICLNVSYVENCNAAYGNIRIQLIILPFHNDIIPPLWISFVAVNIIELFVSTPRAIAVWINNLIRSIGATVVRDSTPVY